MPRKDSFLPFIRRREYRLHDSLSLSLSLSLFLSFPLVLLQFSQLSFPWKGSAGRKKSFSVLLLLLSDRDFTARKSKGKQIMALDVCARRASLERRRNDIAVITAPGCFHSQHPPVQRLGRVDKPKVTRLQAFANDEHRASPSLTPPAPA